MQLRDYQLRALKAIAEAEAAGVTRQLIVCATGLGKTVMVAGAIRERGVPSTLGIMHREELITQARDRILDLNPGVQIGIEKAGSRSNPETDQIILASIQTIGRADGNRISSIPSSWPKILWEDEAHHSVAISHIHALKYFGVYGETPRRDILLLGTTATPDRFDELGYDKIFDDVTFRYDLRDAIRDGWLADIRATRFKSDLDLDGIKKRNRDFAESELAEAIKNSEMDAVASLAWAERCRGKKSLFFCVNKEHAWRFHEKLLEKGAKAAVLVDDITSKERKAIVELFRSGDLEALVNVGIASEGWDVPEIQFVHMMRPTCSRALYVQQIGRGTRKAPGKDFVEVFDYTDQEHDVCSVGTIFGLPDSWDLKGQSISKDADKVDDLEAELGLDAEGASSIGDLVDRIKEKRLDLIKNTLADSGLPSKLSWKRPSKNHERWFISWRNETPEGLGKIPSSYREKAGKIIQERHLSGVYERIEIFKNEIGMYEAKIHREEPGGSVREGKIESDKSLVKLVSRVEKMVIEKRPYKVNLLKKNAAWQKKPCSEKQAELLKRRGVPEEILGQLSQGDASQLISTPQTTIKKWFAEYRAEP